MLDLTGKNALVGIANNRSIAWGIAQQVHKAGAPWYYLSAGRPRPYGEKVAELVEPSTPASFCSL